MAVLSGRGCGLAFTVLSTRATRTAARPRLLFGRVLVVAVAADRRRKRFHRDALIVVVAAVDPARAVAVAACRTTGAFGSLAAIGTVGARSTLPPLRTIVLTIVVRRLLVRGIHRIVVIVIVGIVAALAPLILEARPALAQNAEIMFGELEVIFALDAVAAKLRVAGHVLVFFKQLRRIAALPIVLAVPARLSAGLAPLLPPTTASAAALTIADQMPTSL